MYSCTVGSIPTEGVSLLRSMVEQQTHTLSQKGILFYNAPVAQLVAGNKLKICKGVGSNLTRGTSSRMNAAIKNSSKTQRPPFGANVTLGFESRAK
jgi:hypothetical protein